MNDTLSILARSGQLGQTGFGETRILGLPPPVFASFNFRL